MSDLLAYDFCKRKAWLSRKARIESGEREWDSIVRFRVLRSLTSLVNSRADIHSLTDFLLQVLNGLPGKIVGTEISLERDGLFGRIDVIRQTEDGFIIQEEKSSDPPDGGGVWPSDQLQVDAYAFLAETNRKYWPIKCGMIIYNDLVPRKVESNPKRVKEILGRLMKLLESDVLPEAENNPNKCTKCSYYPLCQILPRKGGLKTSEIRKSFSIEPIATEIIQTH